MENIRCIGLSFYGINSGSEGQVVVMSRKFFPALKYFSLEDMGNLVEWKEKDEVRSTTGAAEVHLFPVLEILNIKGCSQLISAPSHFPSIEELDISANCHISLLKKILSSNIALSSIKLRHNMVTDLHNDEHIESLHLEKRRHSNNLEEDVECRLSLKGCGIVPSEMLERLCHLPCLRDLELVSFPNLKRLACGSSLESLRLLNCENLRELPQDLDKFQALRHLIIWGCPRVNKLGGHAFVSLEELEISHCDGLTSIPGEMLESCASLRILEVYNCPNLVSFPLNLSQTPSLEILHLFNCPKLMIADMPKGFAFLTSLRKVEIGPFSINETIEFDWSALRKLTSLYLNGLPHMVSIPYQLQYLTRLTELCVRDFGIETLPDWIGNLASLQRLWLSGCEKLLYLPSMAAMRRLTKLIYFEVQTCPLLKKRCNPEGGLDSEWPKISHIPDCLIR